MGYDKSLPWVETKTSDAKEGQESQRPFSQI